MRTTLLGLDKLLVMITRCIVSYKNVDIFFIKHKNVDFARGMYNIAAAACKTNLNPAC